MLCRELLNPNDTLIGVSPCVPEKVVRDAAALVVLEGEDAFNPQEWYDREVTKWVDRGKYCKRMRVRDSSATLTDSEIEAAIAYFTGWFEVKQETITNNIAEAIVDILWYHCDVLMHRACYEVSPLRAAIDHLRNDGVVFVVGSDIKTDDGRVVLTQERIQEIMEQNPPVK